MSFNRRVRELSGVERFRSYLCRHTFATEWRDAGGSLAELQAVLGHSRRQGAGPRPSTRFRLAPGADEPARAASTHFAGWVERLLKDDSRAAAQYEECLSRYPKSWNAPEVRRKLESLRRERRF